MHVQAEAHKVNRPGFPGDTVMREVCIMAKRIRCSKELRERTVRLVNSRIFLTQMMPQIHYKNHRTYLTRCNISTACVGKKVLEKH